MISRPDIVKNLSGTRLLSVYNNNVENKAFIHRLTNHQLLEIFNSSIVRRDFFNPLFYNTFLSRPELANHITPGGVFKLYKGKIGKQREFVNNLTSRQLLTLLLQSQSLDDKIELFELMSDSQIDHVNILGILCQSYSMHLAALRKITKSLRNKFDVDKEKVKALIPDFLDTARRRFASIPIPLTSYYLSQSYLNQFSFLFFSPEQLQKINFKKQQFSITKCKKQGSSLFSHHISEAEATPQEWLESVCVLFDKTLVQKKKEIPNLDNHSSDKRLQLRFSKMKPLKLFYAPALYIQDAKAQLQKLSVRQVAFLLRRTYEMRSMQKKIIDAVFPSHLVGTDFLLNYRGQFDTPDEEHKSLPDLSISEAYQILELKPESSWDDIRAQYKKMSRLHHPDKSDDKEKATESFQKLGEAYQLLEKIKENEISTER